MNLKKAFALGAVLTLQGAFLSATKQASANDNMQTVPSIENTANVNKAGHEKNKIRNKPNSPLILNFGGLSYHTFQRTFTDNGVQRKYNERNLGFGLEYHLSDHFHLLAGTYKNSTFDRSVYIGGGYEAFPQKNYGVGIDVGAITGYSPDKLAIPMALPYVRIGKKDALVGAKLGIIPISKPVLTLQSRINLSKLIKKISPSPRP